MPDIPIKFSIPNLAQIVDEFSAKGYDLADKLFETPEFDVLLGTDYAYVIPETSVVFGKFKTSMYSSTPYGILLSGNCDDLLRDVNYLPNLKKSKKVAKTKISTAKNSESSHSLFANCFHVNFEIGEDIDRDILNKATENVLEQRCSQVLNYENFTDPEINYSINDQVSDFLLRSVTRLEDGRLQMPLPWKGKVAHNLPNNFALARNILYSNLNRYKNEPRKLSMMSDVIKSQSDLGIIERIPNFEQFKRENPVHSFLGHMPVFRLDKETTKTRIVYLSNLSEKGKISHNNALHSGSNLNYKLVTAITFIRFNKFIAFYDLVKAFSMIALPVSDQNKLLFLFYKNVEKSDYSLEFYKITRVPFGLPPSPHILLLCLYKIFMVDSENDSENVKQIKRAAFHYLYMDNGAIGAQTADELELNFGIIKETLESYKFNLQ